ncbi:RYamide receptor-like [Montipora capricornis]|uniref:RYamide receptor-like n=1 Tax=Montipora capricornis TaxID=246305 RepID=UPI0035F15B83
MNTTINGSEFCHVHWNPTAYNIGATVAYCLVFVVSLVGNSCIGIIVYKTKTLRKPINFFIVNMAMSDLLIPLAFIPLKVVNLYRHSWLISGILGNAFCKLINFLFEVSYTVSIQSLILIAVGRFGAVVWPLHSPLINLKRCTFFILATWIVAMASMSPVLFAYTLDKYEGEVFCVSQWQGPHEESASRTVLAYYIVAVYTPIILLIIIYSIILIKLKLQKTPGQQSTDAEIQRNKRNTNALKLAIATLLGLIFCKLLWSIISINKYVYSTLPCRIFLYEEVGWFFRMSYCAVNPCICFAFCRNYREGLKRLLKCCSDST